jgi:hypothetical protein
MKSTDIGLDDNVGALDQGIRMFVGIMAGWEFFLLPTQRWWLILLCLFFFLTGSMGSCPIYSLLKLRTKSKSALRQRV